MNPETIEYGGRVYKQTKIGATQWGRVASGPHFQKNQIASIACNNIYFTCFSRKIARQDTQALFTYQFYGPVLVTLP